MELKEDGNAVLSRQRDPRRGFVTGVGILRLVTDQDDVAKVVDGANLKSKNWCHCPFEAKKKVQNIRVLVTKILISILIS